MSLDLTQAAQISGFCPEANARSCEAVEVLTTNPAEYESGSTNHQYTGQFAQGMRVMEQRCG